MTTEKILITGPNGFIGSSLLGLFDDDGMELDIGKGDLRDPEAVREVFGDTHYDLVIHAAIRGGRLAVEDRPSVIVDNLTMAENLLAMRDQFDRFVNIGTGAEFGRTGGLYNVGEDSFGVRVPKDFYGYSKFHIASMLCPIPRAHNLRLFGCFGPFEEPQRLIKSCIRKIGQGERLSVANKYMSFFSIYDLYNVIRAVLDDKLLEEDVNLCYNDINATLQSIAYRVCWACGVSNDVVDCFSGWSGDYSGSGARLAASGVKLLGLDASIVRMVDECE